MVMLASRWRRGTGLSQEFEAAAGAALGGFFGRHRREENELPIGSPCPNCATPLQGPWCHACGQLAEDFHRSTVKLVAEAFEGLLHFDSRFWTTLPDLFRHPARLTKAYLEGHRAPQIPPFRLFLVVLVAIFFAGALGGGEGGPNTNTVVKNAHGETIIVTKDISSLTPDQRAKVEASIQDGTTKLGTRYVPVVSWLKTRVIKVLEDPARFQLVLEQWSERFAFLMLPLAAGLLSLLFVFQRRFFVFDHIIFSLHSLSAVGLMFAANELLSHLTAGVTTLALMIGAPVHLFIHMRGVYSTSVAGTLLRMVLLFIGSAIGAGLIMLGLILVGLNGMGG